MTSITGAESQAQPSGPRLGDRIYAVLGAVMMLIAAASVFVRYVDNPGFFFKSLGLTSVKIAIFVAFIGAQWRLVNALTRFDDGEELYVKGNWAYWLQRISLAVAQALGMKNSVGPPTDEPLFDIFWLVAEGAWVLVLLLAVRRIVDKFVLYRIDNLRALLDGNRAVGAVEGGFYIGFGAIIGGALSGEAPDALIGFASSALFTLLGLLTLIGVFFLHGLLTPHYSVQDGVKRGSLTTGLEAGGALVAIGLVLATAVGGDFSGWGRDIAFFTLAAVVAVVTLYVIRALIDWVVLTNCTVRSIQEQDQEVAAATLAGLNIIAAFGVALGLSFFFAAA